MYSKEKYLKLFINTSIFSFFTLLLVFPKGYNYGSTALLVVSILFVFYSIYKKFKITEIIKQNNPIFFVISLYFLNALFFIILHGDKFKLIDNPLRAFLFLSVIIFVIYSKVKFDVLLYSIPVGSFVAGLVALYQYYILHLPAAFNEQMKIQSGDIAMSLGLFSFIIALYLFDIKKNRLALVTAIAGLFGVLASVLSFARGGWVGVPLIFVFVLYMYRNMISKKLLSAVVLSILVGGISLSTNEQFVGRILDVKNNLSHYSQNSKDGSIGARLDMWKMGVDAFIEHPISGWSLKALDEYKKSLADKGIVSREFTVYSHLHNQFIDELAKKGILGGVAILGIFLVPLCSFYRKQKKFPNNKKIKLLTTLGIVHVLSTMSYCLTQAFLTHNSGNIFYFFSLVLFWSFMQKSISDS
ncbi:O-antigen ligase family protein [Haemophilus haemolyticus]|uniref:O-antigen ligase family protein n=1 Tax=Haemophilus haemolyticus TaxID=726 RepID=UPI000E584A65|nr:O-antigen ligase [Haemophilus haemolyticus]